MVESPAQRPRTEFTDAEIEYRSVEPWAIGGLLMGLLSPVALLAPLMWLVPPLAILANALALRRLAHESGRVGRSAALLGLGLGIVFAVAPPAQTVSAFVILRQQGRLVAERFFKHLREGHPQRAVALRTMPDVRSTLGSPRDEALWLFFRNNREAKDELDSFVKLPLARAMLALGEKADVRFYRTAGMGMKGDKAEVNYWYTVTFVDDSGRKKTIVVGIVLERLPNTSLDVVPWRVKEFYGPVDPKLLG